MERSFKRKIISTRKNASFQKHEVGEKKNLRKSAYANGFFKNKSAQIDFKAYVRFFTPKASMTEEQFARLCELLNVDSQVQQSDVLEIMVPQVKRQAGSDVEYQTCGILQEAVDYYNSLNLYKTNSEGQKKPLQIISLGGANLKIDFGKISLIDEEGSIKYPCGLLYFNDSTSDKIPKATACVASFEDIIDEIGDDCIQMIDMETGIASIEGTFRNQGHFILFFVGEETKEGKPVLSLVDFFTKCYHRKENSNLIDTIYLTATDFVEVELDSVETDSVLRFLVGDTGPFKFFGYNQSTQYLYDIMYACGYDPEAFEEEIEKFNDGTETYRLGKSDKISLPEIDSTFDKRSYAYYLSALKLCRIINEVKSGKTLSSIEVPIVLVEDYVFSKSEDEDDSDENDSGEVNTGSMVVPESGEAVETCSGETADVNVIE